MSDEERDDVTLESEENIDGATAAQAKIKKLRADLKEALAKRDEYLTGWQREKADAINGRREALLEADRRAIRKQTAFIVELLPALDSFDMAASSEAWADVHDGFRSGMEQVRNQLLDVLARNGFERYGKVGEPFDPRLHEAIQEVEDVPGKPQTIVKVLRYGYRSKGDVIRPAQVIVKGA